MKSFSVGQLISASGHDFLVGEDGWIFLVKALMDIENLYGDDSSDIKTLAIKWFNIIKNRADKAQLSGRIFRQIIIPEKIALAHKNYPKSIREKSPLLAYIEANLRTSLDFGYISSIGVLGPHVFSGPAAVSKVDTHLTSFGCYLLTSAIVKSLGYEMCDVKFVNDSVLFHSDISNMISDEPIAEPDWLPNIEFFSREPKLIETFDPPSGGHFTTRRAWYFENAPINRRVLAIGNSYFGWGNNSREMSWWFARMFREFHFIWGHHFVYQDIEHKNPDVIIRQTIERYLGTVAWA